MPTAATAAARTATVARLTRREKIEKLLEHLPDYTETMYALAIRGGGDGAAEVKMPRMYFHPSVVELRRCIDLLREKAPRGCAHLLAYYTAEWRIEHTPERGRKGEYVYNADGKLSTKPMRDRLVPAWVRRNKVEKATTIVVGIYRGEPYLPAELLEQAA